VSAKPLRLNQPYLDNLEQGLLEGAAGSPTTSPEVVLALIKEIRRLRFKTAEAIASRGHAVHQKNLAYEACKELRVDAERYRFVSKLAWYVDRGAQVYDLCNVNSNWHSERGSPDSDDVEEAIDAVRLAAARKEQGLED